MIKKLLITIICGLVVLLVLAGAILLVFSTRGYFSDVITWLLIGLIGILVLFTVYMIITYSIDIVRKKEHDVEVMSERSIHAMLKTGEIPSVKDSLPPKKSKLSFLFSTQTKDKQKDQKKTATKTAAPTQVPVPDKAISQATATPIGDAKTNPVATANTAATDHSVQTATVTQNEEGRKKAVEAVRMQAEAAAIARRKAATMAARSQAFPAIRTDQIPAFNTGRINNSTDIPSTDSRAHILNPTPVQPPSELHRSGSIWEQMNVRQSAAPQLDHPDAPLPAKEITPRQTLNTPGSSLASHAVSPEDLEAAQQPWQPPKQPKAWSATGGKMPGDMSAFAKPNTVQPAPDAYTRAEEARAKTKLAEAKIAATKSEATLEDATSLAEDIRRKRSLAEGGIDGTPRRGRPPKPKTEEELNAPKRPRGRPPKPKTEEELNAPKRPRGRPPKPKTEEELNAPKRPRGRPRKTTLSPEDTTGPDASNFSN